MEIIELAKKIQFPRGALEKEHEIKSTLRSISKKLRDAYYKEAPIRPNVYLTPFGGPIGDSIGPWPEFILRGLPCQKSKQGCCTPCFYSRMPQVDCFESEIYKSLVNQVKYVIHNFDSLVVRNQWGPVAWPDSIEDSNRSPLALVVTPTGSFFDEYEFPFHVRKEILSLLAEHSKKIGRPIALHIESHAEHFLKSAENQQNFNETIKLLRDLNSRIIFGFESSNEYVRNVLYNKFLPKNSFEAAVKLAKANNLPVGAFVFVGANPLIDIETISDSISTLDYLRKIKVAPVVMFHNVQQYTIQELLYLYNSHKLPDPRTVLEVVKYLVCSFPDKPLSAIVSFPVK